MNWFHSLRYITYLFVARHRKGYGVHSPFVFDLIRETIGQKHPYYLFKRIDLIREGYLSQRRELKVIDLGAGADRSGSVKRAISSIARRSAIKPKYGELLSRLVNRFAPQVILEMGTSLGIATLYMALINRNAVVCTIEGCPETLNEAKSIFAKLGLHNVRAVNGNFNDVLGPILENIPKLDFAFIDGNHRGEATLNYFNLLVEKAHNDTVLVFDDIYWSPDMLKAWKTIYAHPRVTVSLDLFRFGIVFFREECQKQHFVVRY